MAAAILLSCQTEKRQFHPAPGAAATTPDSSRSGMRPGASRPLGTLASGAPLALPGRSAEGNAFDLSQGKQLFSAFNCVGCHSSGGGGMGPALMDGLWFYGSSPEDIYSSIARGRPNGMPAFGGRVPEYQIWMLVAYVRSLSGTASGLGSKYSAPGRSDEMQTKPPENSLPSQSPRIIPEPKTSADSTRADSTRTHSTRPDSTRADSTRADSSRTKP